MPKTSIDFSKTKIYKIVCKDVSIPDLYVGHTTNLIKRRGSHKDACCKEHNKQYNQYKYQFIRENGGWDNFEIVLIEDFPCDNVEEATRRERYWVENLNASLNKQIPSRTQVEYTETRKEHFKEYKHQYYLENKERLTEKNKNYHQENKEEIKQKQHELYEKNKEERLEKAKEYRDNNKDTIKLKQGEKIKCECGKEHTRSTKARHLKTQFHMDFICKQSQE
jgi:hypothetical protein